MHHLMFKRSAGLPVVQTVGASPWIYTNASAGLQIVNVASGTVTLVELNSGAGFIPQVGIAGNFTLFPGNILRITYVVSAPTVTVTQL